MIAWKGLRKGRGMLPCYVPELRLVLEAWPPVICCWNLAYMTRTSGPFCVHEWSWPPNIMRLTLSFVSCPSQVTLIINGAGLFHNNTLRMTKIQSRVCNWNSVGIYPCKQKLHVTLRFLAQKRDKLYFSRNPSSSILMHWSMKRGIQFYGIICVILFCVRENTRNSFRFLAVW
jgi:hypothetical protein